VHPDSVDHIAAWALLFSVSGLSRLFFISILRLNRFGDGSKTFSSSLKTDFKYLIAENLKYAAFVTLYIEATRVGDDGCK
jgi:hypothetical protein